MKKLLTILVSLLMIFALVGCSTPSESGSNEGEAQEQQEEAKKIGYLLMNTSYDFQMKMSQGIERCAKEKGYECQGYWYEGDPEKEASGIETLINQGVGAYYGIFMSAEADAALMEKYPDVAIISQASTMPGCESFVDEDYEYLARSFCDSLDYFIESNNITETHQIAAFGLSTNLDEESEDYIKWMTIVDYINDHYKDRGMEIVIVMYPSGEEESANATASILNGYPEVRYFFNFNNTSAIASANEIQSAVKDTSEYFVFATESDEESFRLIADPASPYRACTAGDIEQQGYNAGLELINWIENGKINNVPVAKNLVDARNIADYQ